jgi:signal peptidase I
MRDWRGTEIEPGDVIVYVTLRGHKPVLHEAYVKVTEDERVQVHTRYDSQVHVIGHQSPTRGCRAVWLHEPSNLVVLKKGSH